MRAQDGPSAWRVGLVGVCMCIVNTAAEAPLTRVEVRAWLGTEGRKENRAD